MYWQHLGWFMRALSIAGTIGAFGSIYYVFFWKHGPHKK